MGMMDKDVEPRKQIGEMGKKLRTGGGRNFFFKKK